jgi:ribosomal protein S18 acetylase RimI-like enzyme
MAKRITGIHIISATETLPLRSAVLRPHQSPGELAFPGDNAPDTLHLGAYTDGEIVGIASLYRNPPPGESGSTLWQLRGMAVTPEVQRQGYGKALVERCIEEVAARGGTRLWCNARTPVVGFYQTLGFEVQGEEFQIPNVGPHFRMWRSVVSRVTR